MESILKKLNSKWILLFLCMFFSVGMHAQYNEDSDKDGCPDWMEDLWGASENGKDTTWEFNDDGTIGSGHYTTADELRADYDSFASNYFNNNDDYFDEPRSLTDWVMNSNGGFVNPNSSQIKGTYIGNVNEKGVVREYIGNAYWTSTNTSPIPGTKSLDNLNVMPIYVYYLPNGNTSYGDINGTEINPYLIESQSSGGGGFNHNQFISDTTRNYLDELKKNELDKKITFQGVNISISPGFSPYNLTIFGTIHTSQFIWDNFIQYGTVPQINTGHMNYYSNVILHEYGHALHELYDPVEFYYLAVPQSLLTSPFEWEKYTPSEEMANTLAFFWFNEPAGWDHDEFPINRNLFNWDEQYKLRNHIIP